MKKIRVPMSAAVGFILGAVIFAITFINTEAFEEIFYLIYAVPNFLFYGLFSDIAIKIWIAAFCIIGGLIVPAAMLFIGLFANETVYAKAKKISNIIVTLCFAPYLIFTLVIIIAVLIALTILQLDGMDGIPFILLVLTATAVLLPKAKIRISNETGCTFLFVALMLHVIFIAALLQLGYGIIAYGVWSAIFLLCLCPCVVCGGNLLIMLVLEPALRHDEKIDKLPRRLLTAIGIISCGYILYASILTVAYIISHGITYVRISGLILMIFGFIVFCILTRGENKLSKNEAKA